MTHKCFIHNGRIAYLTRMLPSIQAILFYPHNNFLSPLGRLDDPIFYNNEP